MTPGPSPPQCQRHKYGRHSSVPPMLTSWLSFCTFLVLINIPCFPWSRWWCRQWPTPSDFRAPGPPSATGAKTPSRTGSARGVGISSTVRSGHCVDGSLILFCCAVIKGLLWCDSYREGHLGWVDLDFGCSSYAWFFFGRWEIGTTGWAARQEMAEHHRSMSTQPNYPSRCRSLYQLN